MSRRVADNPSRPARWASQALRLYVDPLIGLARLTVRAATAVRALETVGNTKRDSVSGNEVMLALILEVAEAHDQFRGGRSRRVRGYASLIAEALDLSEAAIRLVDTAAALHDIGLILWKYRAAMTERGRLSREQWEIIKDHPADGAKLVSDLQGRTDLVESIRYHHENWDGTGYPESRAGDRIPLAARIIRFADTIDAMLSDRPYRAALSPNQLRAELTRCRATQFDPQIVDAILSGPAWEALATSVVRDIKPEESPDHDVPVPASLRLLA
jgi:HD-GYP domain-containing protein (c-di-GMP phosphodiesterase class II)